LNPATTDEPKQESEPPRFLNLFDAPEEAQSAISEEDEILAEIAEDDTDSEDNNRDDEAA
jgi:hypothetical protein